MQSVCLAPSKRIPLFPVKRPAPNQRAPLIHTTVKQPTLFTGSKRDYKTTEANTESIAFKLEKEWSVGIPKDIKAFYGIKGWVGEGLYFNVKKKNSVVLPETLDVPGKTVDTDEAADESMNMMSPDGEELLLGVGNDSMDLDEPVVTDKEDEEIEPSKRVKAVVRVLKEKEAEDGEEESLDKDIIQDDDDQGILFLPMIIPSCKVVHCFNDARIPRRRRGARFWFPILSP